MQRNKNKIAWYITTISNICIIFLGIGLIISENLG